MLNKVECDPPKAKKAQNPWGEGIRTDDHFGQEVGGILEKLGKHISQASLPLSRTTLVLQNWESQSKWLSRRPWLLATSGWGLWSQLQFRILFNGLMGNILSTVYQHHWSSCSGKCWAVGKKRFLASFLHKRVWLNQNDVWLVKALGLINSDRTEGERGLSSVKSETRSEKPGHFSTPQTIHEELEASEIWLFYERHESLMNTKKRQE